MQPVDPDPDYFTVEKTRVTVSFPNTPDASVIGANNWLAAGIFVQGQDSSVSHQDYGFYTVLVLDCYGGLWLDVGVWTTHEFPIWRALDCCRTWSIGGVDRSTPITLTMYWDSGAEKKIYWVVTIDGQDYNPPGNYINIGAYRPTIIKKFYVGMTEIPIINWPWAWAYYFQFGIMSPENIVQDGWQAKLRHPQYFLYGSWNDVEYALSMGGHCAFLDAVWRWGGNNYEGVSVFRARNVVTFYYAGTTLEDWTTLWSPEGGSGCPFVYVWNGQQYVIDNNLLPTSEASNQTDVEDYYKLERTLVPTYEGDWFSFYSLRIREFENEHAYLDQVKLLAVDHESDVHIAVSSNGNVLTYRDPIAPISCIDNDGEDRLSEILQVNGNVSDPTTYYYGETGDHLLLNFGPVDSEHAKLILRDDIKCPICCIEVQVMDSDGDWHTVAVAAPRNYWSIEAVDLSEYVVEAVDFLVRLYWTSPHRLDYVGLDLSPQEGIEVHEAQLITAIHSVEGNVKPLLKENDGNYAELTPNQQITLTILLPNNLNEERTFILYTEGRYETIA
jgi:hypothetical protein